MSRRYSYPWSIWFERENITLKYGLDFHCSINTFRQQLRRAASIRGLTINTSVNDNTISVKVQNVERQIVCGN